MAKGTRRTPQEVHALALKVHAAIEGGKSITAATDELKLSENVYRNWLKKGGPKQVFVSRGSVPADQLPPRPKKGGKRVPKKVDMNDIASVAQRIARIDKKLASVEDLREERKPLAERLMQLLKGSTGR